MSDSTLTPFLDLLNNNERLRDYVAANSATTRTLATLEFGHQLVAARVGGDRLPAIVITAGAHATEIEGTIAALQLISKLTTEHMTYIVPARDPIGIEGFAATLHRSAMTEHRPDSYHAIEKILRQGEIMYDEDALIIARFGSLAFASQPRQETWTPWGHHIIYNRLRELMSENMALRDRLNGVRILIPASSPAIEGIGDFDRAWTAVGASDDVLHLNRFFDTLSAPEEVRSVRELLDELQPGLMIDLHAGTTDKFWLPYPIPQQDDELSQRVAKGMAAEVKAGGYPVASLEELRAEGGVSDVFFDPYLDYGDGVTPYHATSRGEGLNFMDYCRRYGVAVGTEAGQRAPLATRVDMVYRAAIGGVRTWESLVER